MARIHRSAGDAVPAASALREAISLLEPMGESAELARAMATLAQEHMLRDNPDESVEIGQLALAMAEQVGAEDVAVHALNTVGTSRSCRGDASGLELVRESLERARAAGLDWDVARAYNNLQSAYVVTYLPAEAGRCFDEGVPVATRGELRSWEQCMRSDHATTLVQAGRWDDAVEHARMVLAHVGTANVHRISALIAIGRVRARGAPIATRSVRSTKRWRSPNPTASSSSAIRCGWLEPRQPGSMVTSSGRLERSLRRSMRRRGTGRRGSAGSWCCGANGPSCPLVCPIRRPSRSACTSTATTARPPRRGASGDARTRRPTHSATAASRATSADRWTCSTPSAPDGVRRRSQHACAALGVRSLPRGPAAVDACQPCRSHCARDRCAGPAVRGPAQRRDRRTARRVPEDRRSPRLGDPHQARRGQSP